MVCAIGSNTTGEGYRVGPFVVLLGWALLWWWLSL